jgi:hypothetical protein
VISENAKKILWVFLLPAFAGLCLAAGQASKSIFPWKFGGYEKIDTFYIKYWCAAKDAFGEAQNFAKPGFPTEIDELWFSKTAQSVRADKYLEKSTVECNQFKGKKWETITENGIEYVLQERIVQSGGTRVQWLLLNISSGGGTELCEYKRSEGVRPAVNSVWNALGILALKPYMARPDSEEMAVASIELDEVMNPEKYKATVQELKKTYNKAGRKTAKYQTNHGIVNFSAEGPVYVDLEWGIALEGCISKIVTGREPPLTFPAPVCIYRVLSYDTKINDLTIFDRQ